MLTLQPPSQPSTTAPSPQLSPMSGAGAPTTRSIASPNPAGNPSSSSLPPSRGHSSHYHHRRAHRHHVTADGRYDDDCGIPQHTEWDLYLTAQQSRHQLLAALKQQNAAANFAPPRPTPHPTNIQPALLLSTDPATLTPLAASVLQLAKQYSLPSTLDLSLPAASPPPTVGGVGVVNDEGEVAGGGVLGGRRASLSRRARGLQVQESVDWSGRSRELSELKRVEHAATEEKQTERVDEEEAGGAEHRDETFITSIADTDNFDTDAPFTAWTECSDVHTAVSRLPSCLHSTPPFPASLSFPRLLSLSPATATLPAVVQPLLVSEPCLQLLHHSLFYCLLLLCGSGDDELERFVAWQAAKRRADAAAEARTAAVQSAGTRAPASAAGNRQRRGKAKEKEAVVRYTYYGEDDQHQHKDANSERMDTATAAAEEDEEETLKRDKRAPDEVPPFAPSRPPLTGPTGTAAQSLVPASHPRSPELSALLHRMSTAYLRLFLLPRPYHLDVFLSHLPAVVSDTLHASYLALFPASLPLLHCELFVERLRETMQALLAGWVATARQHTLTLPDIRRHGQRGDEEKEEAKEDGGEERRVPIFLQRRRATIGTSPLIAHFLSSHSIHTPASLSLTMPLSFPVHLSPAALSALSYHLPPQPPTRTATHSVASLHTQYTAMRAAAAASERADKAAVDELHAREVEARRAALKDREEYARVLVRESQQSKYRQLKMNAKQIALRRLSQWNGQGATRESE